jgi:hypothetical protein
MACDVEEYAIEAGTDVAVPTPVKDIIRHNPTTNPGQLAAYMGPVEEVTLAQTVQFNGTISIVWTWGGMTNADFQALITAVFGGHTVGSIPVTIITRDVNDDFERFNATAVYPYVGRDYERDFTGLITNLRLRLLNLTVAS